MASISSKDNFGQPEYSGPVLYYNDTVVDHFTNPRNVGELAANETDGYGLVGDPACGDQMKLWISIRSRSGRGIVSRTFAVVMKNTLLMSNGRFR